MRPTPRHAAQSARVAFTLAEVTVAIGVGGVVCGAFALVVARQERSQADLARRIRARAQMLEGVAALAADLNAVSPSAGDIPPGGARDSAIQFRATVGTAVVCAVRGRTLVTRLASFVAPPEAGDTAWAYRTDTAPATWAPLVIGGARLLGADAHDCAQLTAAAGRRIDAGRRSMPYALDVSEASQIPPTLSSALTPIRVTRPARYSLYRAPDGAWYLGRSEWSAALGRFASIQPVTGPYRPYAAPGTEGSGLEMRYFAADGRPISTGAAETDRIMRIVITLRALPPPNGHRPDRDSATVSIGLRNRQ